MEINYEWYQQRSIVELEVLRDDANIQLFELQTGQDVDKIEYWSEISAICNSLIKNRSNG